MIKNALIIIGFIAGIVGAVVSLYEKNNHTYFIDMAKVYEEFQLSKEINKDFTKRVERSKTILDSLYEKLRDKTEALKALKKSDEAEINKIALAEQQFYRIQEKLEKENQQISTDNNKKIWNQLNNYIQEYGKKNKCGFIFGANGQGSIMYADDKNEISKQVIEYVNNEYNGIKK